MERLSENQTIRAEGTTGLSRRAFLKHGGGAAIGLAVVPAAGLAATEPPQPTLSASFSNLGQDIGKTLMRMARDIFPHEKLHDKYYAVVVNPYDQKAAADAAFKKLLFDGVNDLNRRSLKRFGKTYTEIVSEGDRVVLLYDIEQSAFFQKLRGDLLFGIYNNKEVWSLFGYEGSSWEKGGYIERGFNNVDWL